MLSFTFAVGAKTGFIFNENDGTFTVFSLPLLPFDTVVCLVFNGLMPVCVCGVMAILVFT
jgi:hypothetical protein